MDIENRIIELVSIQLGVPPESISRESTFQELDADSLDSIEITMQIEDEFNILIPERRAAELRTIGETIEYVTKRMKQN